MKSWFHQNSELSPACSPQLLFPQPSGLCRVAPNLPSGAREPFQQHEGTLTRR